MPHILRGLSGGYLECGCLVGIYETYDGRVVAIVDAGGKGCVSSSHKPGFVMPMPESLTHPHRASFAPNTGLIAEGTGVDVSERVAPGEAAPAPQRGCCVGGPAPPAAQAPQP
jgi:hypothetical protein